MCLSVLQAVFDGKGLLTGRLLELVRHLLWQQRCTPELATRFSSPCIGPPEHPSLSKWQVFAPAHPSNHCSSFACTLRCHAFRNKQKRQLPLLEKRLQSSCGVDCLSITKTRFSRAKPGWRCRFAEHMQWPKSNTRRQRTMDSLPRVPVTPPHVCMTKH